MHLRRINAAREEIALGRWRALVAGRRAWVRSEWQNGRGVVVCTFCKGSMFGGFWGRAWSRLEMVGRRVLRSLVPPYI